MPRFSTCRSRLSQKRSQFGVAGLQSEVFGVGYSVNVVVREDEGLLSRLQPFNLGVGVGLDRGGVDGVAPTSRAGLDRETVHVEAGRTGDTRGCRGSTRSRANSTRPSKCRPSEWISCCSGRKLV